MPPTQLGGRIAIRVYGLPVPQGSKVANRHAPGVRDANAKKLWPWREAIRLAAEDQTRYVEQIHGPVRVYLRFALPRPASHYRSGRNSHLLKDDAPRYPISKNDLDKLQRAALDGLTSAKVWVDDGQAVDIRARKFYAGEHELAPERPGLDIIIEAAE